METFYETYKFLLLELSLEEVVKLLDNEKFKRLFTDNEHRVVKDVIMNIIPNDIHEKDKANALNWIRSSIIKDVQNKNYIIGPGGAIPLSGGPQRLRKYLELFYQIKQQNLAGKFLKQKAIEGYSTFKEFVEDLTEAEGPYRDYNTQKTEKSTKGEGQLLVYEDDNWQIYFPRTKGAACSLGKGTDWCTAAPGLDYYEHYAKDGQLIIFISKKNPGEKYQLHYSSQQFMDKNDGPMPHMMYMVFNKILADNVLTTEYSQLLSKEDREEIKAAAERVEMVDKDHALIDYIAEDGREVRGIYNIKTLKAENPYSPVYEEKKSKYNTVYLISLNHPDNTEGIQRFQVYKKDGGIFTYTLIGRDVDGDLPTEEIYTNNRNHALFNIAYFYTYKDLPDSERPSMDDPSLIMKYVNGYEEGRGNARIVRELPDFSKYMTLGIDKK